MVDENKIQAYIKTAQSTKAEIQKVIVGQENVIDEVLIALLAGGHVLLEGVPGLGKTMLIRTLSEVLDLAYSRIQFTPDLMPSDIIGTEILSDEEGARSFHFQPGPIFANLVLADEINRAPPKTQSAMLEAMQERSVTVARNTYTLTAPFFVMATQNPLEMDGTYPLPEAQLDRFLFKIHVPFPEDGDLAQIFSRTTGTETQPVSKVADGNTLSDMIQITREVPIASHVTDYVGRLISNTQPTHENAPAMIKQYVRFGSSPRGGQALILGAKVKALLAGRFNVAFDDVKAVAPAALRHRLLLNFEGLAEEISTDSIIAELISQTPTQA